MLFVDRVSEYSIEKSTKNVVFCGVFELREFITQLVCAIRFSFKSAEAFSASKRVDHELSNPQSPVPGEGFTPPLPLPAPYTDSLSPSSGSLWT